MESTILICRCGGVFHRNEWVYVDINFQKFIRSIAEQQELTVHFATVVCKDCQDKRRMN